MYINVTNNSKADNKGSSSGLVHYLEKENRMYPEQKNEAWFNHQDRNIEAFEVRRSIDANVAKLGKNDAKFFLINVSPSQKELKHLGSLYGVDDKKEQLKLYAVKVMDEYARNFKREGVNSSADLLWFGKLENNRYYSYKDKEVIEGTKKRGELKAGDQMHIQIVVSRKDRSNKLKLSPMNNSRGKNVEHSKKMGQFNMVSFKQSGEKIFDEQFGFSRQLKDTMAYANIKLNGSLIQKEQLYILEQSLHANPQSEKSLVEFANSVSEGTFKTVEAITQKLLETVGDIFEILMETSYVPAQGTGSMEEQAMIRRLKRKSQGQGSGLSR